MYRLNDRAEHTEGNVGDSGKARLNDDGERAELSVTMQPMTEAAMILSLPAAFSPLPENQLLCIIGL